MPLKAFEVIVGVSDEITEGDRDLLVAEASRYLAYADQTDTFGYGGRVIDIQVYEGEATEHAVGIQFTATIGTPDDYERFFEEMEQLAHVESVEELAYTEIA